MGSIIEGGERDVKVVMAGLSSRCLRGREAKRYGHRPRVFFSCRGEGFAGLEHVNSSGRDVRASQ